MRSLIGITGRKDTSARLLNSPMYSVGQTYVRAIQRAGGVPLIVPPVLKPEDWTLLLQRLDGLLLTGGEDIGPVHYGERPEAWMGGVDLERDASELGLVRQALEHKIPLLGICRGHQVLNVTLRGTLYQDLAAQLPGALEHALVPGRPMERVVHAVTVDRDSRLAEILGGTEFGVNSAHHQAVRTPGEGLVVVAQAPDGVVEATEMPDHPFCVSVQWHPEAMVKVDPTMLPLFEAFVVAAMQAR
ncbi:MAG: gamma-glutamyl-gamma-aminobutyrate hydrolase family protein [Anaerolineae bacterium]